MLSEEVRKYRELSGDTNPHTPISRIGGYLDGYEKALDTFDKIRIEIEAKLCDVVSNYTDGYRTAIQGVLAILDKYKAESEVKE